MKKYEFTGETMEFEGHTLKRIRYLRDLEIYDDDGQKTILKKNDLGGWIESEDNLSHEGESCVMHNAKVFGDARVLDDACVRGQAVVKDNAQLIDGCIVLDKAIIGADTIVGGQDSWIEGKAKVFFYADENYGQPNIWSTGLGETTITGNTEIEATGNIVDSYIENKMLYGNLELKDKRLDD